MLIKSHSYAGATIFAFGLLAMIASIVGVTNPSLLLTHLTFEHNPWTRTLIIASSIASLNMGIYYVVAASTEWRAFFWFTAPERLLTTYVFRRLVTNGIEPDAFLALLCWRGLARP